MRATHASAATASRGVNGRDGPAMKGLVLLTAALVFVLDLLVPPGYALWFLYIVPVLLSRRMEARFSVSLTALVSVLMLAGVFLSPAGILPLWMAGLNRSLAVITLLAVEVMLLRRRKADAESEMYKKELEGSLESERAAREEAERGRETLDALMEHIPEGVAVADAEGVIRMVSRHGYEMTGRPPERVVDIPIAEYAERWELYEPDGSPCRSEDIPLARAVLEGAATTDRELLVKNADGRLIPVLVNAGPIKDRDGNVVGGVAAWRDIAGLKRVEEERREADRSCRLLFENSLDAIVVMTPDGVIKDLNPVACDLFGYTCEELEGAHCDTLFDGAGLRELADPAHVRERREITFVKKGGERFTGEVSPAVFLDRDGREMLSVIIRDVSVRKKLERDKADFLAMVTHDLKSPLAVIQGYTELLETKAGALSPENARGMLRAIGESSAKLLRMVDDFVTVSRSEAGSLKMDMAPTDVCKVLDGLHGEYALRAVKKGLAFSLDACEPESGAILADQRHLERALVNILENAFKFTPEGGSVRLKAEVAGDEVIISVRDTGPGIERHELGRIFDRYYRSTRTKGRKGAGLGLAIAKAIVEAHGGRIWVESVPGGGSTFRMALPAGRARAEAA